MKRMGWLAVMAFAVCMAGQAVLAQEEKAPVSSAELGCPAPALQVEKWVKGAPVDLAACAKTNIVVVEFWATWCPPCRRSIPELTKLQKKYAAQGVRFVGISAEEATTVEDFVKEMADQMEYSVALDKKQATSTAYMDAFEVQSIPHAFIVDKETRIVWHGHPMELEKVLDKVVAGTYDLNTQKKRKGAMAKLEELWELLRKGGEGNEEKIKTLSEELTALDKELGGLMPDEKPFDLARLKKMARFNQLIVDYQKAIMNDADSARVDALVAEMKECSPDDFNAAELNDVRMTILARRYFEEAADDSASEEKLAVLAAKLTSVTTTNVSLLNQMSWMLLTEESIQKRDVKLALTIAKSAIDAGGSQVAEVVDTYARALFDNKLTAEAVEMQKKAIGLTTNAELKAELELTLKRYESGQAKPESAGEVKEGDAKPAVTAPEAGADKKPEVVPAVPAAPAADQTKQAEAPAVPAAPAPAVPAAEQTKPAAEQP